MSPLLGLAVFALIMLWWLGTLARGLRAPDLSESLAYLTLGIEQIDAEIAALTERPGGSQGRDLEAARKHVEAARAIRDEVEAALAQGLQPEEEWPEKVTLAQAEMRRARDVLGMIDSEGAAS